MDATARFFELMKQGDELVRLLKVAEARLASGRRDVALAERRGASTASLAATRAALAAAEASLDRAYEKARTVAQWRAVVEGEIGPRRPRRGAAACRGTRPRTEEGA